MFIVEALLALLAPHVCSSCGYEGVVLCASCIAGMTAGESSMQQFTIQAAAQTCRVTCITSYTGLATALVHDLKFGRKIAAASVIADWMHKVFPLTDVSIGGSLNDSVIISPIPTSNSRVRQRGYDQAVLIGSAYARRCGLALQTVLVRTKNVRQVGSSRAVRLSQARYTLQPIKNVQGKHIILIDDVITTGATVQAAAQALYERGAKSVAAIIFARAL